MPSRVYQIEDIPPTSAWIYELNAEDAVAQCQILDIAPAPTLADNRALLAAFRAKMPKTPNEDITTVAGTNNESHSTKASEQVTSPTHPVATLTNAVSPDWSNLIQDTAKAVALQLAQFQVQNTTQAISSNQLPPVIQDLARTTKLTSGSDPLALLRFLIKVNQTLKLDLATPQQTLLAFLPRTEGQLRAVWSDAIARRLGTTETVNQILLTFYPPHTRHELLSRTVYRSQSLDESFADFVNEVRDFAELLLPQTPEGELVSIIIIGLNSPSRAALAGFPAPTSIQQLLNLSHTVATINRIHPPNNQVSVASPPTQYSQNNQRQWQPRPRWRPPPVSTNRNLGNGQRPPPEQTTHRPSNNFSQNPSTGYRNQGNTSGSR